MQRSTQVLRSGQRRHATSKIPIVFLFAGDPIKFGFVASLNRPGGNMTGISLISNELTAKRLDLLREMIPGATTIAYLTDPRVSGAEEETSDMVSAARALGLKAVILEASNEHDIDVAFETLVKGEANGLVVGPYVLFSIQGKKIVELTERHRLPAMYFGSWLVRIGGLMSYSADPFSESHQIGRHYVGRILKGEKPADLPVQLLTKFELAINLKTAKALGLAIPRTLWAVATEVI